MSEYDQPPKPGELYDQPPPAGEYDQPPPAEKEEKPSTALTKSEVQERPVGPTQKTGEYEVISDEMLSFMGPNERKKRAAAKQKGKQLGKETPKRQIASAPKKPVAKKKPSDVDRSVKQQPPKPPPKQQKKVEIKSKCCIITMVLLTLISLGLVAFSGLAAFCILDEGQVPSGYPWFKLS